MAQEVARFLQDSLQLMSRHKKPMVCSMASAIGWRSASTFYPERNPAAISAYMVVRGASPSRSTYSFG